MSNDFSTLQTDTLRLFTVLTALRSDWPGHLILSCGLGPLGSAIALAANVVGAACLSIEHDPAICRAAMRAGACDFLVNTVDEALRVLKNEIRQRKPLSVALELDTAAAFGELLERGVLPQLFTGVLQQTDPIAERFRAQGVTILDLAGVGDVVGPEHSLSTFVLESAATLRGLDTYLQQVIPSADMRHRWLRAAPRLFSRDRPYRRAVLLSAAERNILEGHVGKLNATSAPA